MSRYLVGMSGDKDKMIALLLKSEERKIEQFAQIREIADVSEELYQGTAYRKLRDIVELCDVYLDKRSEEEKMFDSLNESLSVLEQRMNELQSVVRAIKEGDE